MKNLLMIAAAAFVSLSVTGASAETVKPDTNIKALVKTENQLLPFQNPVESAAGDKTGATDGYHGPRNPVIIDGVM